MDKFRIGFEEIAWENPKTGVFQKIYADGHKQIRLLRFEYGFVEVEWCRKGHIGYVLNGSMTINFNGTHKSFGKGDGLWIEAGEGHQHKVIMEKDGFVELVLFEEG